MIPSTCFFTVCGGGEEYEFLLGSIAHHARFGQHLVLDASPEPRTFKNLPDSVRWVHEPIYGSGWKEFKLRTATERAMNLAHQSGADVLAYLDCDEFFDADSMEWALPLALSYMVEVKTITWKPDGKAYDFGESEWHRRLWPSRMDVEIAQNDAWIEHPGYNGNPEHHPLPRPKARKGRHIIRAHGPIHHHLHYALGKKASFLETAETTIPAWKSGGTPVPGVPWPEPLSRWMGSGELPSSAFLTA